MTAGPSHATMRDVARMAAVSVKTVSRVINDDPAVHPETRGRVKDAVRRLGYRLNPTARSLRLGRDNAVGMVVEDIADAFFAQVTSAVERVVRRESAHLIITSSGRGVGDDRAAIEDLVGRNVAGVIVAPTGADHGYLAPIMQGTPIVFIDRPPVGLMADCVSADNYVGGLLATRHLIEQGHRRIAIIGDEPSVSTASRRFEGYSDALQAAGISADPQLVQMAGADAAAAARLTARLFDASPDVTAIFAASARCAIGALQVLHSRGRTELAFVAFDDFPMAGSLTPAVTVIDQDPSAIGTHAARLLFSRITGGVRGLAPDSPAQVPREVRHDVLPVRLVRRGSGELAPARGQVAAR